MQLGQSRFDRVPVRVHQVTQPRGCNETALNRHPVLRGIGSRLLVGPQSAFGFLDAALEELLAFSETGVANFEILAT
jgi:hypothetical protein